MTNTPPPLPRSEADRLRDALLALRFGVQYSNPDAMAGPFTKVTDYIDQVLDGRKPPITTMPIAVAAFCTLDRLGYTYRGGELWKPPLGDLVTLSRDCAQCRALFDASAAERG